MSRFGRFTAYLRPYRLRMAIAAGLIMAVAGINLGMLWIVRRLVDTVLVQRDPASLDAAVVELGGLFLLQGLLVMGHTYLTTSIGQHVMADFRTHLFTHLQSLSLSFFAWRRTGELMSRVMNDVTALQHTLTDAPIDAAKQIVTLVGGVAILFLMNWRLCLLILLLLPAIVLVARFFGRRLRALSTGIQDETAHSSTILEEVISGIRVVKSFVREDYERGRFAAQIQRTLDIVLKRATIMAIFVPTITFATFAAAAAVLWYGGTQVIRGAMSPGDLVAFVLYAGLLIGPFGTFARFFSQIKEAQGALERVFEILDSKPEVADAPSARPLPSLEGDVTMQRVSFAYDPRSPVLRGISFVAHAGEVVAIVGPTGSGKTTLINLLHRFYDPTEGAVTMDGHDLRSVTLRSLYAQIGLVPQETHLFGSTIHENILYGRIEADEKDVTAAARAANAHDFITAFPDGYETVIGEKGINLSGGQRQRIAIARAVLKNPRILMLDEATSSLDNESELLVQDALDRLMKGRTTFVVAHRLSTIQKADRILVLEHGTIVEEGTHEALLERKGLYYHLYTLRLAETSDAKIS
ncbi:MAG: ABC transporter ATP-binding protein [Nitrospirae bacterium]|nr:MAG: ABC transporter ATP-binding protein [Nitrospirota bacterium]